MARIPLPPSPVVGLLVAGAVLLIIEGAILAAISSLAASVLPVLGVGIGAAVFAFILAALVLWVAVAYSREDSGGLGLAAIILGALSFLVGAGFELGGIFIVVAGALAMLWESVEERTARRSTPLSAGRVGSAERNSSPSSALNRAGSEPPRPEGPGGIVIYHGCPTCGELYRPGETTCPKCGSSLG